MGVCLEDFVQDYDMNVEEFTQDAQGIESATWILKNVPTPSGSMLGRKGTTSFPARECGPKCSRDFVAKLSAQKAECGIFWNSWESSFFGGTGGISLGIIANYPVTLWELYAILRIHI